MMRRCTTHMLTPLMRDTIINNFVVDYMLEERKNLVEEAKECFLCTVLSKQAKMKQGNI